MKLDLLLISGVILTGDDARPRARQIGIWGGRVVGVDEQVDGMEAIEVIDLAGATVIPGFHDAHCHTAWFGLGLQSVNLAGARSIHDIQAAIAERAEQVSPGAWIQGVGLDHNLVGEYPHRRDLDVAAPDHLVSLRHTSGHSMVVGTSVLELAGLMDGSEHGVDGGFVGRDAAGALTGLLEEQAQQLVQRLLVPHSVEDLAAAIDAAGRVYLAEGITSVTEAGIGGGWIGHSPLEALAYQTARDSGRLHTRTNLMVASDVLHAISGHRADKARLGLDLGLRSGFGDDMLRLAAVKVFTDGSLLGRTALMTEPFCGHGGNGYLQRDADTTLSVVQEAHDAGWQVAIHAIGDGGVDVALDAIESAQAANPRTDARHRIEHAGVVRPDQIARIAKLGVLAVTQPNFIAAFGDAMAAAVGESRVGWTYRHASLTQAGVKVVASSDRPVAPGAPLRGIQAMVERLTETRAEFGSAERVNVLAALHSYTNAGAFAVHQDHRLGSLARGKLADLVVLDADPTVVETDRIGEITVLGTMVGGDFAYVHSRFAPSLSGFPPHGGVRLPAL